LKEKKCQILTYIHRYEKITLIKIYPVAKFVTFSSPGWVAAPGQIGPILELGHIVGRLEREGLDRPEDERQFLGSI
jgi:hypothetical protein